jgi:hypothetical protein
VHISKSDRCRTEAQKGHISEIVQQRVEDRHPESLSGGKSPRPITWMGFSELKDPIMMIGLVLPTRRDMASVLYPPTLCSRTQMVTYTESMFQESCRSHIKNSVKYMYLETIGTKHTVLPLGPLFVLPPS